MPNPFPIPRNISTRARRRLKYWLSITVALSRTMPTPRPVKFLHGMNQCFDVTLKFDQCSRNSHFLAQKLIGKIAL